MEAIRGQLNKPLGAGVFGGIVGLVLGMFFAWVVWPVQYTNATAENLHPAYQEDYLRVAIEDYNRTLNNETATFRYLSLGEAADPLLDQFSAAPPLGLSPTAVEVFRTAVTGADAAAADEGGGGSSIWLLCLAGLIVAGVLYYLWFRLQQQGMLPDKSTEGPTPTISSRPDAPEMTSDDPPLAQFITTYELGHDLFDDSFSIDSPSGEFLGECGVGIAESIGVGDPKKVSSYEVWLFDKNDIQTVTKVLMSSNAYSDPTTREQLSAKGEPVLAKPGTQLVLETKTLQMVARVVEMEYGDGPLPDESFFDKITVEMAVWSK